MSDPEIEKACKEWLNSVLGEPGREDSPLTASLTAMVREQVERERVIDKESLKTQMGIIGDMFDRIAALEAEITGREAEREKKAIEFEGAIKGIELLEAALKCADELVSGCTAANGWCSGCRSGGDGCDLLRDYQAARAQTHPRATGQ